MVFRRVELCIILWRLSMIPSFIRRLCRHHGSGEYAVGDSSENTSKRTIHPNVLEVPISLLESSRIVVHIVYRDFVHSTAYGFQKPHYVPTQVDGQPELA